MKKYMTCSLAAAIFAVAITDVASAAPLNTRQVTVLTSSLQDEFDIITVGGPGYVVTTDQSEFALFSSGGSGGSVATFIVEVADFSGTNQFGLYDSASGTKAMIFDGSDTAGMSKLVSFLADGSIKVNSIVVAAPGTFTVGPGSFGFYVDVFEASVAQGGDGDSDSLDYTIYTEDDKNPGGEAQALVFRGDDATMIEIAPFSAGIFTDDEYIIAFEDLLLDFQGTNVSDQDYSDLVVIVESIIPVIPAPGALLLGAMGMGMVSWLKRRRAA